MWCFRKDTDNTKNPGDTFYSLQKFDSKPGLLLWFDLCFQWRERGRRVRKGGSRWRWRDCYGQRRQSFQPLEQVWGSAPSSCTRGWVRSAPAPHRHSVLREQGGANTLSVVPEDVEVPESKTSGVYRPPGARLTTTKRAPNQAPPEIFSDAQFPSLSATAKHVETRKWVRRARRRRRRWTVGLDWALVCFQGQRNGEDLRGGETQEPRQRGHYRSIDAASAARQPVRHPGGQVEPLLLVPWPLQYSPAPQRELSLSCVDCSPDRAHAATINKLTRTHTHTRTPQTQQHSLRIDHMTNIWLAKLKDCTWRRDLWRRNEQNTPKSTDLQKRAVASLDCTQSSGFVATLFSGLQLALVKSHRGSKITRCFYRL